MKFANGTSAPNGLLVTAAILGIGFFYLIIASNRSEEPKPTYISWDRVEAFRDTMISSFGQNQSYYETARPSSDDDLIVTVDDAWYQTPSYLRERWAKLLWNAWRRASDADYPYISIRDSWGKQLAHVSPAGRVTLE